MVLFVTQRYQVIEVVGQWLAVLDHVASVLPICEIIFTQISSINMSDEFYYPVITTLWSNT